MVRRSRALGSLLAGLVLSALGACHTRPAVDAGVDAPAGDAPAADVPGALALDFAVTGCAHVVDAGAARADGGVASCTGTPPLTVTFSPVGSAALTRFRWTFGDDSPPSSERAPTHTYLLPGTYDVGVVGDGNAGSVSRQRPGLVVVTANAAGTPCDVDGQCGAGLFCLCGQGAPCGSGFPHGVCASACPTGVCGDGAACVRVDVPPRLQTSDAGIGVSDAPPGDASAAADASMTDADAGASDAGAAEHAGPAGDAGAASAPSDASAAIDVGAPDGAATPSGGGAGGPTALCLAGCSGDADCAAGLVCRTLPGGASPRSWPSVCVPPYFKRVGDSCRDARGQLDAHVCATGVCADLGALGLCTASCAAGASCPSGSACATLGDGRSLCVATCSTSAPCTSDPLLDCETSNGVGALGFTTSPPAPTATFCAPRVCTSQADCAPSGTCKPLGIGAHCVASGS